MRPLTDAQFWGGMAVLLLANITLVVSFLAHWRKIDKDILRDDKKHLTEWARNYAEQLAQEMFREYVRSMRINVPVTLVNESDIPWSADRKDDAA